MNRQTYVAHTATTIKRKQKLESGGSRGEMKLKVTGKASLKRGFGLLRGGGNQRNRSNRALEGVAKASRGVVTCSEEDGVVRMKIVVKKGDLKHLIQAMGGAGSRPSSVASLTAEQRLNVLRRRHISRTNAMKAKHNKCWTPALQSIPEEL